jgi:hypothetical protein
MAPAIDPVESLSPEWFTGARTPPRQSSLNRSEQNTAIASASAHYWRRWTDWISPWSSRQTPDRCTIT